MAVVSVHESFQASGESRQDKYRVWREADRHYIVEFDAQAGTEVLAKTANDGTRAIPTFGSVHPNDSGMMVANIRATPKTDDGKYVWDVIVHYSSLAVNAAVSTNPLTVTPVVVSVRGTEQLRGLEYWYDPQGAPSLVTNSANDPFDPPIEYSVFFPTITIRRNEGSFSLSRWQTFMGALNSNVFWGQAPFHVKIVDIGYEQIYEANIFYWAVTYVFMINTDAKGWAFMPIDQGSRAFFGSNPVVKRTILDTDLDPKGTPGQQAGIVNLDLNGHVLTQSQGKPRAIDPPHYPVVPQDFTSLRLDPVDSTSVPYG